MPTLGTKWRNFFWMILDPWFLIFIGISALSLILSFVFKANVFSSNLLAAIGSITGGIAGGVFQSQISKFGGENILEKKGQSAVRNLSSIQTQIVSLRTWVAEFSKAGAKEKNVQLEEVDRHLSTMELHIRSGYEDWIDIIPQLRQEKEIQEKYEQAIMTSVNELLDQKMKLAQAADAQEKKNLEQQINKLELQLTELKRDSRRALYPVMQGSSVTGVGMGGSTFLGPRFTPMLLTCGECGSKFLRDRTRPRSEQSKCPDCKKKEELGSTASQG